MGEPVTQALERTLGNPEVVGVANATEEEGVCELKVVTEAVATDETKVKMESMNCRRCYPSQGSNGVHRLIRMNYSKYLVKRVPRELVEIVMLLLLKLSVLMKKMY